jgi:ATP-dependent Clp protease protease subunit
MNKSHLKVVMNAADQSADIFIYGIIGNVYSEYSPITARNFLQQLAQLSDVQTINVRINSPGGDTGEGLAICNAIIASKKNIHTWNDGMAASMASAILCSAKKNKRHAAKGSMTMIHSASTLAWGNKTEMAETSEMLGKFDEVLAEIISDAAELTVEETVAKWMDGKNHWLTAKEAEEAGLVSIEDYAAEELPENVTDMKMDRVAAFYSPSKITNNDNMSILSSKFKTISALGKIAVADRTADNFKAVNDELIAEGITGATLVSDVDFKDTMDAAGKVPALTTQVTDLGTQVTNLTADKGTLTQKVADLQKIVDEQKIELGKPAEEVTNPVTTVTDSTGAAAVTDVFETSYDREAKLRFSN